MSGNEISIFVAFAAGLLSFLSPCVLPLVPGYLGHLAGVTSFSGGKGERGAANEDSIVIDKNGAARFQKNQSRMLQLRVLSHALAFITGFSLVFVAFWASIGAIGQLLPGYIRYVRPLGGIILIILGLNMAGFLRISWLYRTLTFSSIINKGKRKSGQTGMVRGGIEGSSPGMPASFFLGVMFAAGWTPCIGPVLGGIIGLASETGTLLEGTYLLVAYSVGLGVPFLLCALALNRVNGFIRKLNRGLNGRGLITVVSGLFVAIIGVLMLTNVFQTLPQYFNWLPL